MTQRLTFSRHNSHDGYAQEGGNLNILLVIHDAESETTHSEVENLIKHEQRLGNEYASQHPVAYKP